MCEHAQPCGKHPTQDLDLRDNSDLASLPITDVPSTTSRLERLALDLGPAVRVLDQLRSLTALRRLIVDCNHARLREAEVLALLDTVGRLPQLHTLYALGDSGGRMVSMSNAVREARRSLAEQRPCLRLVFFEDAEY